ncbi:hypothetical protein L1049_010665 [Liquidambar formosana]|uniref:Uncharacterized protein n=1 Tax=Liquidambar formosana TaxID=63359 RepID=A0AAP0N9Q6_LIQFO
MPRRGGGRARGHEANLGDAYYCEEKARMQQEFIDVVRSLFESFRLERCRSPRPLSPRSLDKESVEDVFVEDVRVEDVFVENEDLDEDEGGKNLEFIKKFSLNNFGDDEVENLMDFNSPSSFDEYEDGDIEPNIIKNLDEQEEAITCETRNKNCSSNNFCCHVTLLGDFQEDEVFVVEELKRYDFIGIENICSIIYLLLLKFLNEMRGVEKKIFVVKFWENKFWEAIETKKVLKYLFRWNGQHQYFCEDNLQSLGTNSLQTGENRENNVMCKRLLLCNWTLADQALNPQYQQLEAWW